MSPTALITGATGFLGRAVVVAFERQQWNVVGTGLSRAEPPLRKLDLQQVDSIAAALDEIQPEVVVHCAANKFPDQCEANPQSARSINVGASANLARLCAQRSIFLIYISTDYVFPGVVGEAPYEADHPPRPINVYGQSKWEGEQAVAAAYDEAGKQGQCVALRVPVLYGSTAEMSESSINALVKVVYKAQEQETKVDHYATRYPTCIEDVGRVCVDITSTYRASTNPSTLPRVLHFSGTEGYTKYDVCLVLAEILGLATDKLIPLTEADPPDALVKRPFDSQLSNTALRELAIDTANQDFRGWWRRELKAYRK